MKIKELVKKLKRFNQESELFLIDVELSYYHEIDEIIADPYCRTSDNREIINIRHSHVNPEIENTIIDKQSLDEKKISDSFDRGEWKSTENLKEEIEKTQIAARNYLNEKGK